MPDDPRTGPDGRKRRPTLHLIKVAAPGGAGVGCIVLHLHLHTRRAGERQASDAEAAARTSAEVLQFPVQTAEDGFTLQDRTHLRRVAARMSGPPPLFKRNGEGGDTCSFGNGLVVSRTWTGCLAVNDTRSGYVDHGPFENLSDVCDLLMSLPG